MKTVLRAVPVTFALCALALPAQERPPESGAPLVLSRIQGPVTLDGRSDEAAWQGIAPLPCVCYLPDSGAAPSERTEILIAYDDDFLYAAGRMYDREPDKVQATSKKRDDMKLSNDWFCITLDTFVDRENALCFSTNPAGLRLDMTIFNDAQGDFPADKNWNTFWDVATARDTEGWFAEIRIPLSSLRFQAAAGRVVMGLIATRYIARKNEAITFPFIPPKWGFWGSFKPSRTQPIVLEGVTRHRPLYVAPYVLGGYGRSYELDETETAYGAKDKFIFEPGLDVKYGLTNNLTLDLTL
ncbi:MAG: carbohydrate binding family 9 domain-containing protein, partial [Candidatus Aminicenantes bacterium]|nr:carbohydrate binding family 9 domain-containing protein [Candidatus Aminicenantes bacterium]